MENMELKKLLKDLFASQSLAVLATQGKAGPYGNLVAFAVTDDLKHLLFATARATRKYDNLMRTPSVAMVMDNRSNQEDDFDKAVAVTATGTVREVVGAERAEFQQLYLERHPVLRSFVTASTCALFKVDVDTYTLVNQFQNVMELPIKPRPL
jgi:heme iron utilization protein